MTRGEFFRAVLKGAVAGAAAPLVVRAMPDRIAANEIRVSDLSSMSVDMGTITSGTITTTVGDSTYWIPVYPNA